MGGDDSVCPLPLRASPVEETYCPPTTTSTSEWATTTKERQGRHEGPSPVPAPPSDMEVVQDSKVQNDDKPEPKPMVVDEVATTLSSTATVDKQADDAAGPTTVQEVKGENQKAEQQVPSTVIEEARSMDKKDDAGLPSQPSTNPPPPAAPHDSKTEGAPQPPPLIVPPEGHDKKVEEVVPMVVVAEGSSKGIETVPVAQDKKDVDTQLAGKSDEDKLAIMGLFGLHQDTKALDYKVNLGEPDDPSREVRLRLQEMHESRVKGPFQIRAIERELDKLMARIAEEKEAAAAHSNRIIEQQRQQVDDMRAQIQSMRRPSTKPEDEISRLRDELEASEQMCQDLSLHNNMLIAEMNRCKEKLISSSTQKGLAHAIPVRWFCEATEDEVRECLDAPSRTVLNRAFETVDRVVRDTTIDPFIRENGMIVGEERTHEELKAVTREYGPYLVDLIVAKKREVEKYCPSGGYPTPILWERGQELAVSEVITRLISAIPKTKGRARAPHVGHPQPLVRASSDETVLRGTSQSMTQGMMGGGGLAVPHVAQTAGSAASSLDAGRRPQRNARLAQDSNKNSIFEFFDGGFYTSASPSIPSMLDNKTSKLFRDWVRDNTTLKQKKSVAGALQTINQVLYESLQRWEVPVEGRKISWQELAALLESHKELIAREVNTTTEANVRLAWRRMSNFVRSMKDATAPKPKEAVEVPRPPRPLQSTPMETTEMEVSSSPEPGEEDMVTEASFRRDFRQWLRDNSEPSLRKAIMDSVENFLQHLVAAAKLGKGAPLPLSPIPLTADVIRRCILENRAILATEVNVVAETDNGTLKVAWHLLVRYLGIEQEASGKTEGVGSMPAPMAVKDYNTERKNSGRPLAAASSTGNKLQAVVMSHQLRSGWMAWMVRNSKADEATRWGYIEAVNNLLAAEVGQLRDATLDEIHKRLRGRATQIDQALSQMPRDSPVQVGWRMFLEFLAQIPASTGKGSKPKPAPSSGGGQVSSAASTGSANSNGSQGCECGPYDCVKPECLQIFKAYLMTREDCADLVRDFEEGQGQIQLGVGQVLRSLGLWGGRVKNPENILSFIRLARMEESFRGATVFTRTFLAFLVKAEQAVVKKRDRQAVVGLSSAILAKFKEWLHRKKGITHEQYIAYEIEAKLQEVVKNVDAPRLETQEQAARFFDRLTVRTIAANTCAASALFLEFLGNPNQSCHSLSRTMLYRFGYWLCRYEHLNINQPQVQEIRTKLLDMVGRMSLLPLVTEEEAIAFFSDPVKRSEAANDPTKVGVAFLKYLETWTKTPNLIMGMGIPVMSQAKKWKKHEGDDPAPRAKPADTKKETSPQQPGAKTTTSSSGSSNSSSGGANASRSSSPTALSLSLPVTMPFNEPAPPTRVPPRAQPNNSNSNGAIGAPPATATAAAGGGSSKEGGSGPTVVIFGTPLPSSIGKQDWDHNKASATKQENHHNTTMPAMTFPTTKVPNPSTASSSSSSSTKTPPHGVGAMMKSPVKTPPATSHMTSKPMIANTAGQEGARSKTTASTTTTTTSTAAAATSTMATPVIDLTDSPVRNRAHKRPLESDPVAAAVARAVAKATSSHISNSSSTMNSKMENRRERDMTAAPVAVAGDNSDSSRPSKAPRIGLEESAPGSSFKSPYLPEI